MAASGSSVSGRLMTDRERNIVSRKSVIDEEGEAADLLRLEQAALKPFASLPQSLQAKLRGRPKVSIRRESLTIRLSPPVVQTVRASGVRWQTGMDEALKEWLKSHKVA